MRCSYFVIFRFKRYLIEPLSFTEQAACFKLAVSYKTVRVWTANYRFRVMSNSVVPNFVTLLTHCLCKYKFHYKCNRFCNTPVLFCQLYQGLVAFVSHQPGERIKELKQSCLAWLGSSTSSLPAACLACFDAFLQTWIYMKSLLQRPRCLEAFQMTFRSTCDVTFTKSPRNEDFRLFETFMSLLRPWITTSSGEWEVQSEQAQDSNLHSVGWNCSSCLRSWAVSIQDPARAAGGMTEPFK